MTLWQLDEFLPGTLIPFVRTEPIPATFRGAEFLPDVTTNDLSFEYILGARRKTVMAHVMGFDSEAPIASRQAGGERVQGELPPIKRKSRVGEKEMIRFLQPRNGTSDQQDAVMNVYQDLSDLVQSIYARVEWLRIKALSEETVIYDEDGVKFEFDFGLDQELRFDLVTKKDGTDASIADFSGSWENVATSDPVNDIAYITKRLRDKTGQRAREFVLDGRSIDLMYRSEALRVLARGENGLPGILTTGEIDEVFRRYELPSVSSYDVFVGKETETGAIVDERVLASGKGFIVPEVQIGQTLWGPTAESRVLLGTELSTSMPGLFAGTYTTDEPPAEWTKVAAVAFPTMPQAHALTQVKVR